MRPIVRMREIYCRVCRRKSLVNPLHSTNCLKCGRPPYSNGGHLRGRFVGKEHAECPDCKILHPGRNVGAPLCGRCNQRREGPRPRPVVRAFVMPYYDSDDSNEMSGSSGEPAIYDLSDYEDEFLVHDFQQTHVSRPLDPAILSTLKKTIADQELSGNECTICIEQFKLGDSLIALKCKHVYHESCVLTWFQSNDSCPLCRKKVN